MAQLSALDQKIAQTSSNEVFFPRDADYGNWKKDVGAYVETKTNFQGHADPYVKVTNKHIKAQETRYNPITQVYTNPATEKVRRDTERDAFINVLAKNKDRALRYEQTYNVINFENKLAGLEDRPDYPKEKPWYFRPERDSLVDYNIVSNYDLKDHHYDAPDKRPECAEFKVNVKENLNKNFKDYNIVSNKYLEHHDTKVQTDEQILKAEAAQRYWKTHDFDPINAKYYDDKKETTFVNKRDEEAKIHGHDQVKKLPITVQNEGLMYNPVNMKIEDERRLYERDLREKNKKARYEVRYDVESTVRKEGLAEQDRLDQMSLGKVSGLRFKEETQRGYDILTNGKLEGSGTTIKMEQVGKSGPVAAWNKVLYNANENDQLQDQIQKLEQEEYYLNLKKRGINAEFKRNELDKLSSLAKEDPLKKTVFDTRSKRLTRTDGFPTAPPKSNASKTPSNGAAPPSNAPKSAASNKVLSVAPSSRREIRTGGFSKLGENIVGNN